MDMQTLKLSYQSESFHNNFTLGCIQKKSKLILFEDLTTLGRHN